MLTAELTLVDTSVYNEPAEIKSFQILQCTLEPEHRTIGVDPVTKLVRPGYSMTPNITERHFERLNTENEYPWNPMKGTEFEHDASMVSACLNVTSTGF